MEPTPLSSPNEPGVGFEVGQARQAAPLANYERLLVAGLAMGLLSMLAVAAVLTPSPTGLGTHQQLGLPPCSTRWLFGIRCPGCGMTTSWAWMMKGNGWRSFQSNAGGAIFCILAIWAAPIAAYVAWLGKGTRSAWFSRYGLMALVLALIVTIVDWIYRIYLDI